MADLGVRMGTRQSVLAASHAILIQSNKLCHVHYPMPFAATEIEHADSRLCEIDVSIVEVH